MAGPLNLLKTDFSHGQIPDSATGRVDRDEYRDSVRRVVNMDITANGSVLKRPGMEFIWSSTDASLTSVKWTPFIQTDGTTIALLVTEDTIYGFFNGGVAIQYDPDEAANADIDTLPIASVSIGDWGEHTVKNPQSNIRYTQIGDSLYMTRPRKPVFRLKITVYDEDDDGDGDRLQLEWIKLEYQKGVGPRFVGNLTPDALLYAWKANTLYEYRLNSPDQAAVNIDGGIVEVNPQGGARRTYDRFVGSETTSDETEHFYSDTAIVGMAYGGGKMFILTNVKRLLEVDLDTYDLSFKRRVDIASFSGEAFSGMTFRGSDLVIVTGTGKIAVIDPDGANAEGTVLTLTNEDGTGLFPSGATFAASFGISSDGTNLYSIKPGGIIQMDPTGFLSLVRTLPSDWDRASLGGTSCAYYANSVLVVGPREVNVAREDIEVSTVRSLVLDEFSSQVNNIRTINPAGTITFAAMTVASEQGGIRENTGELDLETFGFSSIAYYQGRLALGGHPQSPNAIFLSDVNAFDRFTEGVQDDDALFLQLITGPDSGIHWMGAWQDRLVMASVDALYQLRAGASRGAVTPQSFSVLRTTGVGASFETELIISEQGLLLADQGNNGLYRYGYDFDTDLFSSHPITAYVRDIENRRVVSLHYAHGSPARVVVDTIGIRNRTREDLINLQVLNYLEADGALAGVEYRFPGIWDGLGGSLTTPEGIWVAMIGTNNPGARDNQHPFIVGYIDAQSDRELDASVLQNDTTAFTQVTGGLEYFGDGQTLTVRDRANGTTYTRVKSIGGGLTENIPSTTSIEVGLPVAAELETLPVSADAPTFGNNSRITRCRAYIRKPVPALSQTSFLVKGKRATENIAFANSTPVPPNSFTQTDGTPYWVDIELDGGRDPNNAVILEMNPTERVELLAVSLRYESGEN